MHGFTRWFGWLPAALADLWETCRFACEPLAEIERRMATAVHDGVHAGYGLARDDVQKFLERDYEPITGVIPGGTAVADTHRATGLAHGGAAASGPTDGWVVPVS
jgi:hypothetical protein